MTVPIGGDGSGVFVGTPGLELAFHAAAEARRNANEVTHERPRPGCLVQAKKPVPRGNLPLGGAYHAA